MTFVPLMMIYSPGDKVSEGPHGEGEGRHIPDHNGVSGPFDDLRKMVRTGNIPEQPSVRYLITITGCFPEPYKHVVGTDIKANAHAKHDKTYNELWAR